MGRRPRAKQQIREAEAPEREKRESSQKAATTKRLTYRDRSGQIQLQGLPNTRCSGPALATLAWIIW